MTKQTMGEIISRLRKEQGMTQRELAEKMGVTDKAVSKWERDLSCPDISSIPTLAEVLGVSVDELLNATKKEEAAESQFSKIMDIVLKAVPIAMGVCVTVTAAMKQIDLYSGFTMLGIGLACVGINLLSKTEGK